MAEGCVREPEAGAFTQAGRKKNLVCSIKVCINNSLQSVQRIPSCISQWWKWFQEVSSRCTCPSTLLRLQGWGWGLARIDLHSTDPHLHFSHFTRRCASYPPETNHLSSSGGGNLLQLPNYSWGANLKSVFGICFHPFIICCFSFSSAHLNLINAAALTSPAVYSLLKIFDFFAQVATVSIFT